VVQKASRSNRTEPAFRNRTTVWASRCRQQSLDGPRLRKAAVVAAVNAGELSAEDACSRYGNSAEEFEAWAVGLANSGPPALRVTRRTRWLQVSK
jgi:hypothetical protein